MSEAYEGALQKGNWPKCVEYLNGFPRSHIRELLKDHRLGDFKGEEIPLVRLQDHSDSYPTTKKLIDDHMDKSAVAVPLMTKGGVYRARMAIRKTDVKTRQAVLDLVVDELKRDSSSWKIDPSLLEGGKMHYNANLRYPAAGLTTPRAFHRDESGQELAARPIRVAFGPTAFDSGVSYLVSIVMHEYQHVLQYQRPAGHPAFPTHGQRTGYVNEDEEKALELRQEVEAYAQEILQSKQTGTFSKPELMQEKWKMLHNHWLPLIKPPLSKLPRSKQANVSLNNLYEKAHEVVSEALGPKRQVPYEPLGTSTGSSHGGAP